MRPRLLVHPRSRPARSRPGPGTIGTLSPLKLAALQAKCFPLKDPKYPTAAGNVPLKPQVPVSRACPTASMETSDKHSVGYKRNDT